MMSKKSLSMFSSVFVRLALAGALVTAAAGCSGASSPDTAVSPTSDQAEQASPEEAGGFQGVFARSLRDVELRADQKQVVSQIEADLKSEAAPVRAAKKELALTLADQVSKNAIDQRALDAGVEKLSNAIAATKPGLQAALDKLHATLDATQRKALVESLHKQGEEKRDAFMSGEGEGRAHMKKVAEELGLTSDQKQQIKTAVMADFKANRGAHENDREAMREHMKAIGEAFASDSFDAKTLDVGKNMPEMVKRGATRIVKMTEATLPVLNDAQRAKLATMIRDRADKAR